MKEENLITYCGVYGGSCARWRGYSIFRDNIHQLTEWLKQQVDKAKQGYEFHGKKYFQLCAYETPPKI